MVYAASTWNGSGIHGTSRAGMANAPLYSFRFRRVTWYREKRVSIQLGHWLSLESHFQLTAVFPIFPYSAKKLRLEQTLYPLISSWRRAFFIRLGERCSNRGVCSVHSIRLQDLLGCQQLFLHSSSFPVLTVVKLVLIHESFHNSDRIPAVRGLVGRDWSRSAAFTMMVPYIFREEMVRLYSLNLFWARASRKYSLLECMALPRRAGRNNVPLLFLFCLVISALRSRSPISLLTIFVDTSLGLLFDS